MRTNVSSSIYSPFVFTVLIPSSLLPLKAGASSHVQKTSRTLFLAHTHTHSLSLLALCLFFSFLLYHLTLSTCRPSVVLALLGQLSPQENSEANRNPSQTPSHGMRDRAVVLRSVHDGAVRDIRARAAAAVGAAVEGDAAAVRRGA